MSKDNISRVIQMFPGRQKMETLEDWQQEFFEHGLLNQDLDLAADALIEISLHVNCLLSHIRGVKKSSLSNSARKAALNDTLKIILGYHKEVPTLPALPDHLKGE